MKNAIILGLLTVAGLAIARDYSETDRVQREARDADRAAADVRAIAERQARPPPDPNRDGYVLVGATAGAGTGNLILVDFGTAAFTTH